MGKDNVLDFNEMNYKRLKEQFELEGCDNETLELVAKLVSCSPGSMSLKKKEQLKAELLNRLRNHRDKNTVQEELSDDELDAAAGGIKAPDSPENCKTTQKPPANNPFKAD